MDFFFFLPNIFHSFVHSLFMSLYMRAPFAVGGFEGMRKADACAQLTGLPSHEFVVDEVRIHTCEERIYRRVDAWVVMFYMFIIVSSMWNVWKVITLLPRQNTAVGAVKVVDPAASERGKIAGTASANIRKHNASEEKKFTTLVNVLFALPADTPLGDALKNDVVVKNLPTPPLNRQREPEREVRELLAAV